MITFFRKRVKMIIWALLFDEAAFRRWARGAIGTVAVSGAIWADQVEPILGHKAALVLKGLAVVCVIGVGMHGDPLTIAPAVPTPGAPTP